MYTLMVKKLREQLTKKDSMITCKTGSIKRKCSQKNSQKRASSTKAATMPKAHKESVAFSMNNLTTGGYSNGTSKEDALTSDQRSHSLTLPSDSKSLKVPLKKNGTLKFVEKNKFRFDFNTTNSNSNLNAKSHKFNDLEISVSSTTDYNLKLHNNNINNNNNSSNTNNTISSTSENQNEVKALQVLGIVFIVFIITWLPFCILNMLSTILEMNKLNVSQLNNFIVYFTYLGYFQSTLNPIIYTIFNRKFRKNFIEIIKCRKRDHKRHNCNTIKEYHNSLKKEDSLIIRV